MRRAASSAESAEMMEVEGGEEEDGDGVDVDVDVDSIVGDSSSEGDRASSLSYSPRSDEEDDDDDPSSSDSIVEGWRNQVCMWCYAVADYYGESEV